MVTSTQRAPLPITQQLREQIERAQALKVPFILFQERETTYRSSTEDVATRSYLVACFTLENQVLSSLKYRGGEISSRNIISIPRDISQKDMSVVMRATLAHQDLSIEDLRVHHYCQCCETTTEAILELGTHFARFAQAVNGEGQETLEKWASIALQCAVRRESALLPPAVIQRLGIRLSAPIQDMYTPALLERSSSGRSSSVMRRSARANRMSVTPFSRPASSSRVSRAASVPRLDEEGMFSSPLPTSGKESAPPITLSPKKATNLLHPTPQRLSIVPYEG